MHVHVAPWYGSVYQIDVYPDPEALTDAVNTHLVDANEAYFRALIASGRMPILLRDAHATGLVQYGKDPDEIWLTAPWAYLAGILDCEDLASLLAAEDRAVWGIQSYATIYQSAPHIFHVVVARPDDAPPMFADEYTLGRVTGYRIVDPSRSCGMGRHARGRVIMPRHQKGLR